MKSSATTEGPSQRQLRVGEAIRHALSSMLMRGDIHDDVLATTTVTVPEVRCSPDLRNATVFVMPLGGERRDEVLAALRANQKYIRGAVARAVNLKYAPQLSFKVDTTFDEAQRIGRVLAQPEVRRDLAEQAHHDDAVPASDDGQVPPTREDDSLA